MSGGPYRTPPPAPPKTQIRCCGLCDQAAGGCLREVVFKATWGNIRCVDDLPAGISERAPQGTRPLVSDDGGETWKDE